MMAATPADLSGNSVGWGAMIGWTEAGGQPVDSAGRKLVPRPSW